MILLNVSIWIKTPWSRPEYRAQFRSSQYFNKDSAASTSSQVSHSLAGQDCMRGWPASWAVHGGCLLLWEELITSLLLSSSVVVIVLRGNVFFEANSITLMVDGSWLSVPLTVDSILPFGSRSVCLFRNLSTSFWYCIQLWRHVPAK